MARTLNNEVDVLNIASLDNDIKDSFTRAMITEDVNTTSAAARRYLEGEYFIHTDRYLYKALEDIAAGTIITPDVNAEVVTVSEELVRLFAQSPEGIFEILSNVENTSVASKNYVKGSQFIWTDKKLYEATADIASGSTFVVGTNIKLADNLTSQIETLANGVLTNTRNGAHNFWHFNLSTVKTYSNEGTWSNNVYTINGGTVTVYNDGHLRINGTFSGGTSEVRYGSRTSGYRLSNGEYKLLGGISNNIRTSAVTTRDGAYYGYATDSGDHPIFTVLPDDGFTLLVVAISPGTYNNVDVYPQVVSSTDPISDFMEYTMSNRELTKVSVKYIDVTVTTNSDGRAEYGVPGDPIGATCLSENYCYVTISTYNGMPRIFYVKNGVSNAALANKQVTIRIYYI